MKKIIFFDLDGTLLYTLEDLTDSTNFALNYFNYPQLTIPQVRNYVGNGVAKLIERAIPNGCENNDYKFCLDIFKKNYAKNMFNKTRPYPGIVNLLSFLKSKNIKIIILSNKFDLAVKNLAKIYFDNLYDLAIGENENEGIPKKPNPQVVLSTLNLYNLKKSQAIFVGDSEVDIQTAKNSQIDSISVLWGYKDKDFLLKSGTENFAQTPVDILKYFE